MKKFLLVSLICSALSVVHATTLPAPSSLIGFESLDGQDAYEWGVSGINLAAGQQITSASITFTGVTLNIANSSGTGYLYTDLLNLNNTGVKTLSDNDASGDYFKSSASGIAASKVVSLNTEFFSKVGKTITWTITFSASALAALNADVADGIFDIGIDPDCHYTVNGLSFTYQTTQTHVNVPDAATTAILLGISFAGLLIAGRKLKQA
jgi:hypothetical protein